MDALTELSAHALGAMIQKGEIGCREAVDALLDRITRVDGKIGGYITVCGDMARAEADRVQRAIRTGEISGPLAGVPVSVKDNMCTRGIRTTCGSKMLDTFVPPYSATVVEALSKAGMPLVGKLNMDEFAMGSSTETSYYHVTRNPWDLSRVPGGSSGGAAAAVAADETPAAIGSDTGGSIRQPAAFCGIVGMKPTYGRVSRYGLVAFASSLDQIGPLAKDVEDCALLLEVICGHDEKDTTSADVPVPDFNALRLRAAEGLKGMRIGIPTEYMGEGLADPVRKAVLRAGSCLEAAGAVLEEVSLPMTEYAIPAYYLISSAEASSNLARYDGVKYGYRAENCRDIVRLYSRSRSEGFGDEVKRRIMLGTYALSAGYYEAFYRKAMQVRTLIRESFHRVLTSCDAILCPVAPTTAFRLGEKISDPLAMYLGDIYTASVNIAGLPGVSVPCGFDGDGMPAGIQLVGRAFDEGTLLRLAQVIEDACGAEAAVMKRKRREAGGI